MSFITEWLHDIASRTSLQLPRTVRVEGMRRQHVGPSLQFAKVEVLAEPSASFEVAFGPDLKWSDNTELFLQAAVFGILDVLLVSEAYPLRNVRITIVSYQDDPVDSSQMAFRHAGREAGRRILAARAT